MCGKITITLTRKWDLHTTNYIYILFRDYPFTTGANIRGVPMFAINNHK